MTRPLRLEMPGGLYHVLVRGSERRVVFRDDRDRTRYLERLAHYQQKFGFQVWAYCLMSNHVHLAIARGEARLSRIMARLQSSYTQYFNRRHRRSGHLFQGRYKAYLVEKDRYALALIRYIHENPSKARMVSRPEEYVWSSDRYYRRGHGPEWLEIDRVLQMLARVDRGEGRSAGRPIGAPGSGTAAIGRPGSTARARLLTAWLAREIAGTSVARTAKYFRRDTSTFAKGIARLEESAAANPQLRRAMSRLRAALLNRQSHNATSQD